MTFVLVENPAYAGKMPRKLTAVCHDGTPFVTVRCACGYELHLHESQLGPLPRIAEIATRCHSCNGALVFPPGFFADAFAKMREQGWVA